MNISPPRFKFLDLNNNKNETASIIHWQQQRSQKFIQKWKKFMWYFRSLQPNNKSRTKWWLFFDIKNKSVIHNFLSGLIFEQYEVVFHHIFFHEKTCDEGLLHTAQTSSPTKNSVYWSCLLKIEAIKLKLLKLFSMFTVILFEMQITELRDGHDYYCLQLLSLLNGVSPL